MTSLGAGVFRSLRGFNFRVWSVGALVSNVGTWMQRVAQDWLVLTQLTHHSATAVGIVMALQFGPQLLLLPWTGAAADRFDQRKLLMATQGAMGLCALILGALTVAGVARLWEVYLLTFLAGCAAAFDAPVRQTFVAALVGDEDLPNAVALNSTSFNAAQLIGPAAAGLTIAAIGTGWAFVLNGVSFGAVLLSLCFLRLSELRHSARAGRHQGGFLGNFLEGLCYVRDRPDLKAVLIMLFLFGTFGLNFPIFISTMAVRVFHTDARGFGLLSSIMAIGALLAAARGRIGFGSLLVGAGVFGAGCVLAALAPGYGIFAIGLVVIGVSAVTFTNGTNSLMQLSTEPAMRGRVMALRIAIALGGAPIGSLILGWVADRFGPRWTLGFGAAAGFSAAAIAAGFLVRQARATERLAPDA